MLATPVGRLLLLGGESAAHRAARYGLVSFWGANENSGNLIDGYGSRTLADNAGVTSTAGVVGTSRHFAAASGQYFSVADNPALSSGNVDFGLPGWWWFDSQAANMGLVGKWTGAGQREYILFYNQSTNRLEFYVTSNGSTTAHVTASTFGAVPTGQWLFVFPLHDSVNDRLEISVNGGAFDQQAYAAGVFDGTGPFHVGWADIATSEKFDGRVDALHFLESPPDGIAAVKTEIRDFLYRGGAGREYPNWQQAA